MIEKELKEKQNKKESYEKKHNGYYYIYTHRSIEWMNEWTNERMKCWNDKTKQILETIIITTSICDDDVMILLSNSIRVRISFSFLFNFY